jgi:hypothetical protein
MLTQIHETALADLSDVDRAFLTTIAGDDGPSRMHHIAQRLGVDDNYAGRYRLRLIAAEMIHATGHGRVHFQLREHLRQQGSRTAPPQPSVIAVGRGAVGVRGEDRVEPDSPVTEIAAWAGCSARSRRRRGQLRRVRPSRTLR